jgi:hypothetical protein
MTFLRKDVTLTRSKGSALEVIASISSWSLRERQRMSTGATRRQGDHHGQCRHARAHLLRAAITPSLRPS